MRSVADAVAGALGRPGEPWLPGLAITLAETSPGWKLFDKGHRYGTARWLQSDPDAVRDVVGSVDVGSHTVLVEVLPKCFSERFAYLQPAAVIGCAEVQAIRKAVALIGTIPDLARAVGSVTRVLHVLRAAPGYDVSHSEPTIPFSAFVSIPGLAEKDLVIRLAESVVHEAMHLQLTLIENCVCLVARDGEGFSPWQGRDRPIGGLLHGLYVFSVILRFMDIIATLRPDLWRKARQRRAEIEEEVGALPDFGGYLTPTGRRLRARCLEML